MSSSLLQRFIKKNLYEKTIISYLFYPLSIIFSNIQKYRRLTYQDRKKQYKSRCKIISVGNIVSGGSGKTPVTIFLATHLSKAGFNVAVSHRGYKGDFEDVGSLISDENEVFDHAEKAGDEAYLLAKRLRGIPVIAGRRRRENITILENRFPDLDFIILDDSFQHLKVYHDIDIIVFNSNGGYGNGFVLPAGILRESLSALKYADYVIFNGNGVIPSKLNSYKIPILQGFYRVSNFYDNQHNNIAISILKKKRIILLSGIGFPSSFEFTVREVGLTFEDHLIFGDHFNYTEENLKTALAKYRRKADVILTTEKDFAKLEKFKLLLPLIVVAIEFHLPEVERINFS